MKRVVQQPEEVGDVHFRRRKAAAPLKPGAEAQDRCSLDANFRRRKAAAPLKRRRWPGFRSPGPVFPPSKGGGPIEASRHESTVRGSRAFPPSKGGGPIEAMPARLSWRSWPSNFRRRKAAAPLKLAVDTGASRRQGHLFRRDCDDCLAQARFAA